MGRSTARGQVRPHSAAAPAALWATIPWRRRSQPPCQGAGPWRCPSARALTHHRVVPHRGVAPLKVSAATPFRAIHHRQSPHADPQLPDHRLEVEGTRRAVDEDRRLQRDALRAAGYAGRVHRLRPLRRASGELDVDSSSTRPSSLGGKADTRAKDSRGRRYARKTSRPSSPLGVRFA